MNLHEHQLYLEEEIIETFEMVSVKITTLLQ